jgi:alkylhydroperoxidase/carboxymuconolactone decarboxylase family protein YurZ
MEALLQTAICREVPAAVGGFRPAREVFAEIAG